MAIRPEIFVSATSRDLKSCRQLVRDALLTLGCVPVTQDHFPPVAGEVKAMLRERIAGCHAVLHLVGECYGFEPQERDPREPRRSYTQLEYDMARELKKPLYTFVCAPDFPYDTHEPEAEELQRLQAQHRAALTTGDHLYLPVKSPQDLGERVRELQTRVDTLSKNLQKTHSWLGRGIAAVLGALLLIAGLIYGVKWQATQRAERAEAQLAALQGQLQQQTKLIGLVNDKLDRQQAPSAASLGKGSDPTVAARAETARELGISVPALEQQLAVENMDVRTMLAKIEQGSAAAEAQAAGWRKLKREALTKLGDAERAAGHYAAMVAPYEQALALIDPRQEPLAWCNAAGNLTSADRAMGRYDQAEELARKALEKRTALLGTEHPNTLTSVNNLGSVLYYKGSLAEAEALFRRALEVHERTLGKDHPDTMESVYGLGSVLYYKGDFAEAEALFRRALEVHERTLGKDHPDTLSSVFAIAGTLTRRGDFAGAETLYRRCLEARECTLGKEHPDTLNTASGLAVALHDEGNDAEAEKLDRRCLEAYGRTLGKEHPDTISSMVFLGVVLEAEGNLAEAEPLFRQALEVRERTLGKEHPDTIDSANTLGYLLSQQGDNAHAVPLLRRVLEAHDRLYGKECIDTVNDADNLAEALGAMGDYAGAEPLFLRAEAGMAKLRPPDYRDRLDLDYCFSLMRQKQGRLSEALPPAQHAAEGAAKTLPADNPLRVQYEKNLRDVQAKLASASSGH